MDETKHHDKTDNETKHHDKTDNETKHLPPHSPLALTMPETKVRKIMHDSRGLKFRVCCICFHQITLYAHPTQPAYLQEDFVLETQIEVDSTWKKIQKNNNLRHEWLVIIKISSKIDRIYDGVYLDLGVITRDFINDSYKNEFCKEHGYQGIHIVHTPDGKWRYHREVCFTNTRFHHCHTHAHTAMLHLMYVWADNRSSRTSSSLYNATRTRTTRREG
jgi:hypothetical protein